MLAYYIINKLHLYISSGECWRCSQLCIFFSILAAIVIASAIAAALISILNRPSATTGKMHDFFSFQKKTKLNLLGFISVSNMLTEC